MGWAKNINERHFRPLCSWVDCKADTESEERISVYLMYSTIQFLCYAMEIQYVAYTCVLEQAYFELLIYKNSDFIS